MIIRIVRMHFQADKVSKFLELFHASEERIRNMPGCQALALYQDAGDPTVYYTHSRWDSEEHLNLYRDSETFGEIWPRTKLLFASKPMAFSLTEPQR